MPDDPKWRLIARRAKRPIGEVIAVFARMMANASLANKGGILRNWNDEVAAAALDTESFPVTTADVAGVREAMQGVVLDGDALMGWAMRQPKREDAGAAARVRDHRERKRASEAALLIGTTAGGNPTNSYPTTSEAIAPLPPSGEPEVIPPQKPAKARSQTKNRTRIDPKAQPTEADHKAAMDAGLNRDEFRAEWARFRDWHLGNGSLKADWPATWRTWLRNRDSFEPRGGGGNGGSCGRPAGRGHESSFIAAARERLERLENATASSGHVDLLGSTLPDAAFATADDPIFAGTARGPNADKILDLESI